MDDYKEAKGNASAFSSVIVAKIAEQYHISEDAALDRFYQSATGASFADDETGLYGQSPNYIFGLLCRR